ncbi:MAG: tetratricopeptide repeat protein [Alphaproteobacteria bacterium]|jgi:tetratricopeptide (TPR) repeat protein|nr:tetratricopeptide repeat protein [Alphaproteobacteria bacterium]
MRMTMFLWTAALILLPVAAAADEFDTNLRLCESDSSDPDRRITACTWLLSSDRLGPDWITAALGNRGVAYHIKGDLERAIQDLDKVIQADSSDAKAYWTRGLVYFDKGYLDRSIRDFDEALNLRPDYVEAYNSRGVAYDHKGDSERAIRDYDEAIRLRPSDPVAYYNRGLSYYRNRNINRNLDRAIRDFDAVVRLRPDHANAYFRRGNAYYRKGNVERAIQDLEETIRLRPNLASAYGNLAWLYATTRETRFRDGVRAVRLAQEAVKLDDSGSNREALAAAYAEAGSFAEAVAEQQRAIEMLRAERASRKRIATASSRRDLYRSSQPHRQ